MITSILQLLTIRPRQIPWSELRQMGRELDIKAAASEGEEDFDEERALALEKDWGLLQASDVLKAYSIPYTMYLIDRPQNADLVADGSHLLLPPDVPWNAPAGVIVALNGELYVVAESAIMDKFFMMLVPAQYIDITK